MISTNLNPTQLNRTFLCILSALLMAFVSGTACVSTEYKSVRNITVDFHATQEENVAEAQKIAHQLADSNIKTRIQSQFPAVTEQELEPLEFTQDTTLADGQWKAAVVARITFTDQNFPANDIMDFCYDIMKEYVEAARP
ncbi:MAG: hypothetical protein KDK30_06470 [Leptospiraceae bacterium]|nr:hypothetical protein [Leptospiraceae bacterium]